MVLLHWAALLIRPDQAGTTVVMFSITLSGAQP